MVHNNLSMMLGRKRLKISEVAEKTGLSRTSLRAIYHERCTCVNLNTVEKLCDFLGCSIGEMFYIAKGDGQEG